MTKRYALIALVSSGFLLAGCEDNPTVPDLSEDLHAELEFASPDLVTLTPIEAEVRVHSNEPGTFTDFATISVELRLEGETEWESQELTLHEDHFTADIMFHSSGEYEARVVGQVTGSTDVLVLYQATEHLHVDRIHQEVGDYIVEFETFPGHLHEGETVEVVFWILEASTDGHAHGHPVGGLTADIVYMHSGGTTEHAGHEHMEGEYGAEHTLVEEGTATFELHFTDPMNVDWHAEFSVSVEHAH
jgi:hypothetical protein